jgi:hypothetical protein
VIVVIILARMRGAISVANAGKILKNIVAEDVAIIHVSVGSMFFVLGHARKDVIHVDTILLAVVAIVVAKKKIGNRGRM